MNNYKNSASFYKAQLKAQKSRNNSKFKSRNSFGLINKKYICARTQKQIENKCLKQIKMKDFLDENFLLDTDTAVELYHKHAAPMPIIDYHCHLSPQEIAENKPFANLTQLWLSGDHYKWRAMRTNGIPESHITGDATDKEKFKAWAATVPYTLRNPLYTWTHLELRRTFGISELLNSNTADDIYARCNEKLNQTAFTPQGLIRHYNVETLCTTDDPIDHLKYHKHIKDNPFGTKVLPAWRPDKSRAIDQPFYRQYLADLSNAANLEINNFQALIDALQNRHDYFANHGCKLSDHGLGTFPVNDFTIENVSQYFDAFLQGKFLTPEQIDQFQSCMLTLFGEMDHEKGWVQQYHYGALRNNNTKMYQQIGPDTGFDSIGEWTSAEAMSKLLDRLNSRGKLAKTILYNLNPNANAMIGTMIGNFQDGSCPSKMQFGSGWWFMDQKEGMTHQINTLSQLGLLSRFVGMLTDSRSFTSYPRHEFFRRILCQLIGKDIENGEIPMSEIQWVEQMIENICYHNAKNYFQF